MASALRLLFIPRPHCNNELFSENASRKASTIGRETHPAPVQNQQEYFFNSRQDRVPQR